MDEIESDLDFAEHFRSWFEAVADDPQHRDTVRSALLLGLGPDRMQTLARALLPLYFGRVAALIGEMQGLDQAGAERVVEQQALAFEQTKPYLLERWA